LEAPNLNAAVFAKTDRSNESDVEVSVALAIAGIEELGIEELFADDRAGRISVDSTPALKLQFLLFQFSKHWHTMLYGLN
jgi:hypothetical protein